MGRKFLELCFDEDLNIWPPKVGDIVQFHIRIPAGKDMWGIACACGVEPEVPTLARHAYLTSVSTR